MFMNYIYHFISLMFSFLFKIFPYSLIENIFDVLIKQLGEKNKTFITYHQRPVFIEKKNFLKNHTKLLPKTAVIIQGPILKEKKFTVETCKWYKKTFANSVIILSTWEDEDQKTIADLEENQILVILNKKPAFSGTFNINFQIVSTLEGLKRAAELGCEYALKTRTDQRLYNPDLDIYLHSLIKNYPIPDSQKNIFNERIVISSFTTLKYRPYCVSDMFMFGNIKDMTFYWSAELDNRPKIKIDRVSILDSAKLKYGEVYTSTEFLKRINWTIKWTIEDSWKVFKNFFILMDHHVMDLYWPKYDKNLEHRFKFYYPHSTDLYGFYDWISELNLPEDLEKSIINSPEGGKLNV